MRYTEQGILLRILVGETDKHDGVPLYEVIVLKARELGLAGASVFRGIMGFGADSILHTAKVLRLSEDLPVLIEMVDKQEKIDEILSFLDEVVVQGLITYEKVNIIKYENQE